MKPIISFCLIISLLLVWSCNSSLLVNPQTTEQEWQTYTNQRFKFSINYPRSWPSNQGTSDGNGIFLYSGDPNIDIRVYGSLSNPFLEPFGGQFNHPNFQQQPLILDSGKQAILITGTEGTQVVYWLILEQQGVFYQLEAHVSQDFFRNHDKTLLKVAKSLNIWQTTP